MYVHLRMKCSLHTCELHVRVCVYANESCAYKQNNTAAPNFSMSRLKAETQTIWYAIQYDDDMQIILRRNNDMKC